MVLTTITNIGSAVITRGREAYEPNSNQFLPEFMLTGYEVVDRQPGWLFRPDDRYDRFRITMVPR